VLNTIKQTNNYKNVLKNTKNAHAHYKFGQNPWKDVDSSVHKDVTEGRTDGRKDGSVTISLRNFVGEEIIN
jgi:hypothetical protein